jgi:hypothetical protein
MVKKTIILSLFSIAFFSLQCQQYTFNDKQDSVFLTGIVNELFVKEGTPLCFDGTLNIHTTNRIGVYLIEVLDTVTRDVGKLNIAAYTERPEGGREKIFIDKFTFNINKGPQPRLFLGQAVSGETLDTANLDLRVGFIEEWPSSNYQISELSLVLDKKEVITTKNSQLNQALIHKIKNLPLGTELSFSVSYKDILQHSKRISGVFFIRS